MSSIISKHQRLAALRPLSPESVVSLAAAWDVRMVYESNSIERAARLHHGIAHIHPFADGNGRTARLAMNFILLAAGYPPISIPTDLRQAYYSALEAADAGDFTTWQNFLTTQLTQEPDAWLEALQFSSIEN